MPGRRATSRSARPLWRLPVILLSGVFMLITAGMPATATPSAASREFTVDAASDPGETTVLTGVRELPDVTVKAGSSGGADVPSPPSSFTVVDPLDLYLPPDSSADADSLGERAGSTTDPDRGPPRAEQL